MSRLTSDDIEQLRLEYDGYDWAVENEPWSDWGISRQQYWKHIRKIGLGKTWEAAYKRGDWERRVRSDAGDAKKHGEFARSEDEILEAEG